MGRREVKTLLTLIPHWLLVVHYDEIFTPTMLVPFDDAVTFLYIS
jgi:hypothetical protein